MELKYLVHPIKYVRLLTTPPCTKCKNGIFHGYGRNICCKCEKYLEHRELLKGIRWKDVDVVLVRGTRFCKFEREEGEE